MSKLDHYNLSYNEIHSLFLENLGLWKSFRSLSIPPNFNFFYLPTPFAVQKALTELSIQFNRLMNFPWPHNAGREGGPKGSSAKFIIFSVYFFLTLPLTVQRYNRIKASLKKYDFQYILYHVILNEYPEQFFLGFLK